MANEGVTAFPSFYYSIKRIKDPEEFQKTVLALCRYAFEDETLSEPEIDELGEQGAVIYPIITPIIDSSKKNRDVGKKGGRPKKEPPFLKTKTPLLEKENPPFENEKEGFEKTKTNKKKNKNIEIEEKVEVEKEKEGGRRKGDSPDYVVDALKDDFQSQELAKIFSNWIACRTDPRMTPYPPAAMADDLAKATDYEKEYGAKAVIDVIESSYSYKRIAWDKLTKKSSGMNTARANGEDDYFMRLAKGEEE